MRIALALLILLTSEVVSADPPATEHSVFLGGFLHYQESGKRKLEANETLGSFVEGLGGIIRGEYEIEGKREVVYCLLVVTRRGKQVRFWFDKDGTKAWEFRLKDGDVISVAERMWIAADKTIPKDQLKFPPARFKVDHAEQGSTSDGDQPGS